VAATAGGLDFCPHDGEVARVIEWELGRLGDPAWRATQFIERRGLRFRSRMMVCGEDRVWGATGMILAELAEIALIGAADTRGGAPGASPALAAHRRLDK
jgi:hypothetical protein